MYSRVIIPDAWFQPSYINTCVVLCRILWIQDIAGQSIWVALVNDQDSGVQNMAKETCVWAFLMYTSVATATLYNHN